MNNEHIGKNYLVVGASSGIGEAIVEELAELGGNVTMVARRIERMEAIKKKLLNGNHSYYGFDVSRIDEIFGLVTQIVGERYCIDGLVYAAGVADTMRLRDLTNERLNYVMRVNFYSFIEFVRALVIPKPRKSPLHIVAISSLASVSSDRYFTAYSASKAAMDAAIRCLARELIGRNVNINSIRPAVVDVERIHTALDDITDGGINKKIIDNGFQPMGLIPARAVARAVAYYLSDSAKYVTGTSMYFNGGAAC